MDYKTIFELLNYIINLQFTQTILIAIVTIGGVWYTQQYERKRWEEQRKLENDRLERQLKLQEERDLKLREREDKILSDERILIELDNNIKTYEYILSDPEYILKQWFEGNRDIKNKLHAYILLKLPINAFAKYRYLFANEIFRNYPEQEDRFNEYFKFRKDVYKALLNLQKNRYKILFNYDLNIDEIIKDLDTIEKL